MEIQTRERAPEGGVTKEQNMILAYQPTSKCRAPSSFQKLIASVTILIFVRKSNKAVRIKPFAAKEIPVCLLLDLFLALSPSGALFVVIN